MAYKLEFNHPDFPKDWPFEVEGVAIKNGETKTLTAEDEQIMFNRAAGLTVKEVYGHKDVPNHIKLTGTAAKEGGE